MTGKLHFAAAETRCSGAKSALHMLFRYNNAPSTQNFLQGIQKAQADSVKLRIIPHEKVILHRQVGNPYWMSLMRNPGATGSGVVNMGLVGEFGSPE